jgi:hypothetical protein
MARPEAAMQMGFFPAPEAAVEGILKHLVLLESQRSFHLLDPCAGEGKAIKQISEGLGVPEKGVYAVELHVGRGDAIRALMPEAQILAPADFKATEITARAFGCVYANPPFDNEFGVRSRREELSFARDAMRLVCEDGVLVLVVPFGALIGNRDFCLFLDSHLKDVGVWRFPDGHRNFQEIVVIGHRRAVPYAEEQAKNFGFFHQANFHWRSYGRPEMFPQLGDVQPAKWLEGQASYEREKEVREYVIPPTWRPSKFLKKGYTDEELDAAVNASGLNKLVSFVEPPRVRRPPLPPGKGHIAMILASGMIDGVLFTPEGTHVVRGVARKKEYLNEEASGIEIDEEKGEARIKEVISEKIDLSVRAVGPDGVIHTFTDNPEEDIAPGGARPDGTQQADAGRGPNRDNQQRTQASVHPDDIGNPSGFPPGFDFDLYAKLARMTAENGCTPAEEEQAKARMAAMKEGVQFTADQMNDHAEAKASA